MVRLKVRRFDRVNVGPMVDQELNGSATQGCISVDGDGARTLKFCSSFRGT